jgi:two-component system, LytTR family, response regulator
MFPETITAIIIDDEPDAINLLEFYLRNFPFIRMIGKETLAKKGIELVRENLPELVFLDIDMPDMSGLIVAKEIKSDNFCSEIIFTTAYQNYAYNAIDFQPLDFLTKPFTIKDLEKSIGKFVEKREKLNYQKKLETFLHSQAPPTKIKLPSKNGLVFIYIKDIVIIRSTKTNCTILLSDGTEESILLNLYKIAGIINSPSFLQISRSVIINQNYLQRIERKSQKCTLIYGQSSIEEKITRSSLILFEKNNG